MIEYENGKEILRKSILYVPKFGKKKFSANHKRPLERVLLVLQTYIPHSDI